MDRATSMTIDSEESRWDVVLISTSAEERCITIEDVSIEMALIAAIREVTKLVEDGSTIESVEFIRRDH